MRPHASTTELTGRKLLPQPPVLRGRRLFFARGIWIALATLTVGLFVASVPVAFARLHTVCEGTRCDSLQLSPEGAKALEGLGLSIGFYAAYNIALAIVVALGFWVIGAILFWKRSDLWLSLYASIALVTFGAVQPDTMDALADSYPGLFLPVALVYFVGNASLFVLFCLFPDGRFVPRWTRWTTAVWVAYQLLNSFFPDSPFSPRNWPLPIDVSLFMGLIGSLMVAQIYRYRRVSGPLTRQQTKWVVFGFSTAIAVLIGIVLIGWIFDLTRPDIPQVLYELVGTTVVSLAALLIPISFSISIRRHFLWDIELLINRALVYGFLSATLLAVFAITNVLLQYLFFLLTGSGSLITSVASVVVAVLTLTVVSRSLSTRLERRVNRLIELPLEQRLQIATEVAISPGAVLTTIVETAAKGLKLPYAAITLKRDDEFTTAAEYGRAEGEPVIKTLSYQGREVGQLILYLGKKREQFTPVDLEFIENLAQQAGVTVHAIRLTADLQRSRERLVTAREEERRRLKRELHDGVGPLLAGLALKYQAVRNLLKHNPEAADELLDQLMSQTHMAWDEVRGLVDNLRPPEIDKLGLLGAIRAQMDKYSVRGGDEEAAHDGGVDFSLEAPQHLPPLPAAVEVAAYRIAQEAMTNIVSHAQADTGRIRLSVNDVENWLEVEITDDGHGLPEDLPHRGEGLGTMHERAEELGGTCVVERVSTGGTRVLAHLPWTPSEEVLWTAPAYS